MTASAFGFQGSDGVILCYTIAFSREGLKLLSTELGICQYFVILVEEIPCWSRGLGREGPNTYWLLECIPFQAQELAGLSGFLCETTRLETGLEF